MDTGIADEHVNSSVPLHNLLHTRLDLRSVLHITCQSRCPLTQFGGCSSDRFCIDIQQANRGTTRRERSGELRSQPLSCSGDDHDPARKFQQRSVSGHASESFCAGSNISST